MRARRKRRRTASRTQVYLSAARKLGVAPETCVAVEDSVNGVLAAKAAKMTYSPSLIPAWPIIQRFVLADAVLGSLAELNGAVLKPTRRASPAS